MSAIATISPPPLPAPTHARFWILLSLMAIGAVYVYSVDPMSTWTPSCAFYEMTGLYCPGCGLTRAVHALLHGHVAQAIRFNPVMIFVVPAVGVRLLWDAWNPHRRRRSG